MINTQIFLTGMLVSAALSSLATEAVKKIFDEQGKKYACNALAGVISTLVSTGVGGAYIAINNVGLTTEVATYWVGLVFMTWLCSMVGYDKVVQTITQFKEIEKNKET